MPGIVYVGTLACVGAIALEVWRSTKQREHLWELYALRDELRRLAIDDEVIANSQSFLFLDSRLTEFCSCHRFQVMSLWHAMAGFLVFKRQPQENSLASGLERRGGEPRLADIYGRSISSIGSLLLWRHIALFTLLLPTIVLPIVFWSSMKPLARYVFANTTRSAVRSPGTVVPT